MFGLTPPRATPVGLTPVGLTPVGLTPVGLTPVGATPSGVTPADCRSLSTIFLIKPSLQNTSKAQHGSLIGDILCIADLQS